MHISFVRASILAALALALAACSFHVGVVGLRGSDVEQRIAQTVAPSLTAFDSHVKVGPATCDAVVVAPKTGPATCTIAADGIPLAVAVEIDPETNDYTTSLAYALFERAKLETTLESTIHSIYGKSAVVRCPMPAIEELPAGAVRTCAVVGLPKVTTVRFKAKDDGGVFVYYLAGLPHA